jgi:hypothetical protein
MDYRSLSREDFDAIATGELTHYAIWLENALIKIIAEYFAVNSRQSDFERLLLRRDGLTFQDKLEITRAMLPLFSNQGAAERLKGLLGKIEEFKATRNAFAHGVDVTPHKIAPPSVHIGIVSRSGKEKTVEVTPESHMALLSEAESLLHEVWSVREALRA